MAEDKSYYAVDPGGRYRCLKCGVPLVKANAVFGYLDNAFPVSCRLPEVRLCVRAGGTGGGQGALRGEGPGGQVMERHPRRRGVDAPAPGGCGP